MDRRTFLANSARSLPFFAALALSAKHALPVGFPREPKPINAWEIVAWRMNWDGTKEYLTAADVYKNPDLVEISDV